MSQPILLIVEHATVAKRVRDAFQASGHQVTVAVDLDAAVNACAKVEPRAVAIASDLAVLAVEDAITQLRARAGLRTTPFLVLMSGDDPRPADPIELGAEGFVEQDSGTGELQAALQAVLDAPRPNMEGAGPTAAVDTAGGTMTAADIFGDLLEDEPEPAAAAPPRGPLDEPFPSRPAASADKALEDSLADVLSRPAEPAPKRPQRQERSVDDLLSSTLAGLDIGGLTRRPPATPRPPVQAPSAPAERPEAPPVPAVEPETAVGTPEPFAPEPEPVETPPETVVTAADAPPPTAEPAPVLPQDAAPADAGATPEGPAPAPETEDATAAVPAAPPAAPPEGGAVAADETLPAGRAFGQYELIETIATGGMAEVYKARMRGVEGFQKILAIKRILPHLTANDEFVTMFIDEAKLAAQLQHPNIIHIYDLGKIEGSYYIAMEYIDGKDLRSVLATLESEGRTFPLGLALFVGARVAAALDYANRKRDLQGQAMSLVHRDVSPQNVLISFDGDIKLCDFGIAKAASKASHTRAGALKGKLQYMSPEQAWGKEIDHRSDIFSLGLVLYEMITGTKPFSGDSELSILEQVRSPHLTPPSEIDPEVPPEVERILLKALDEDRETRYQTAGELAADLENAAAAVGAVAGTAELGALLSSLRDGTPAGEPAEPPSPRPARARREKRPEPAKPAAEAPAPVILPEPSPSPLDEPPGPTRRFPVAAVAVAAIAVLVVVLVWLLTSRPSPSAAPAATTPELQEMIRERAAEEVAKQEPALRERLAGEVGASDGTPTGAAAVPPVAASTPTPGPRVAAPQVPAAGQGGATPTAAAAAAAPASAGATPAPVPTSTAPQVPSPASVAANATGTPAPAGESTATVPVTLPEPTPEPAPAEPAPTPVPTVPPTPIPTRAPLAALQPTVREGDLVELGPGVIPPEAVSTPKPEYPPLALRQRVGGIIILDVLVDENGDVQEVRVLRGVKPDLGLAAAAEQAVRRWKFRPATKDGVRVKIHHTVTVPFRP